MSDPTRSQEPSIVARGYQLCALLSVCECAARSLDNVPDGDYRDQITNSLGAMLEFAGQTASDLLTFAETHTLASGKAGA